MRLTYCQSTTEIKIETGNICRHKSFIKLLILHLQDTHCLLYCCVSSRCKNGRESTSHVAIICTLALVSDLREHAQITPYVDIWTVWTVGHTSRVYLAQVNRTKNWTATVSYYGTITIMHVFLHEFHARDVCSWYATIVARLASWVVNSSDDALQVLTMWLIQTDESWNTWKFLNCS